VLGTNFLNVGPGSDTINVRIERNFSTTFEPDPSPDRIACTQESLMFHEIST